MPGQNTVGLLLAAGQGRRFDPTGAHNKLTQFLPGGTPVAVQSAQNLLGAVNKVIAVVRCTDLAWQLREVGCEVQLYSQVELGMGASMSFAMQHVLDPTISVDSVLVALADMPFVQTETIKKVVAALASGADIAQPNYQHQPGHPIGFSKRHFPALIALEGDVGARHLLQTCLVQQVAVDDIGILRDIDFMWDLNEFNPETRST